ncbi:hypothetical protein KY290_007744 [Solanum tuberosum]|uniref:Reverse transcriptase zinc-binding domain-containing protein n=1 Tax=Solanum tuberosum TaxID=4113 RepID=A0ABQ7W6F5_SOLTU|nr:hypothetical protein KY290_007744 [Solanum tuberosum]
MARLSQEMTEYIIESIKPPFGEGNDTPWWMGNTQGDFTVKSAWQQMRKKKEERMDYDMLLNKGVPFKVDFFLWKVWKKRIPTDDNLKRMSIPIVSRCWCCVNKVEETMTHLFLTAPIAIRLLRQFANFAGINLEGMHLQQIIIIWWKHPAPPKLQVIYRAMPAIIM